MEDSEGFVSFRIGGLSFDLCRADEKSPCSRGGSVGYFLVDDLEGVIAQANNLGGSIYRGPLKVDETQRTIAQILDPFGNVIGLEADF